MFSAIFSIVFAMGLVSVESSTVQSAFEVAMRCTKKGWEADVDALASGPVTEEEILEDACIYLREFARCVVNTDPSKYASPEPNIVHFLAACEWQHLYIAERAGICANMPTEKLKKIALDHGVMEKENLKNVEKDEWHDCVGLTMRKCMLLSENLMKEGKSMDFVSATTEYINCFKKADKYKCPAKMLDHYIHTMDVYYQYLEEDKR
ncbi:uncharacterized protein [Porites lutea]|uniref:uncharacterized protein n=1 Tax=Porites lutea TaxID=51062 RepID=UPI003CC52BEC